MKAKIVCLYTMCCMIVALSSCKKNWLDAKPNEALVIPTSAADYQALLDNTQTMNYNYPPALAIMGDGDFYLSNTIYNSLEPIEQGAYIWADTQNFFGGETCLDWTSAYTIILNANVVMDGLQTLKSDANSQAAYNNVKGSALFFRGFCYYSLTQEFCKLYNSTTAASDLGLPLRTSSNVNIAVARSSVQQTYNQIINDLLTALPLLPVKPLYPTRPSKPAVFGLLSRVYLSQQNYSKAFLYADSCLQLSNTLIDFNSLTSTASYPITRFNVEDIFHCELVTETAFLVSRNLVDSILYRSYTSNDLRNVIYYRVETGGHAFKGSYNGNSQFFGGIATDEMYLTRAECFARAGNTNSAMTDLNTLLTTRWKSGTYTNMTAANADSALSLILKERRKELCFRGLRWTDLRRLNTDTRFQTTISRTVNGQVYTLPPNSSKYVLPLDDYEIQVGGLVQNPR